MANPTYPWEKAGPTVTFATPEQVEVTYRVAGFGARILAALLDHLVILAINSAIGIGFILLGMNLSNPDPSFLFAVWLVISFLTNVLFFVWAELFGEGRTWGKRLMHLRTVMISGHGLTFGGSVIRNLARVLDSLPVLWLVPLFSTGQRRLGDLVAGTLVINERHEQVGAEPGDLPAASYRELVDKSFLLPAEATRKLYPDDLNLLDHLFSRLRTLTEENAREALCRSVARKYIDRLALAEQAASVEGNPKRFLEELYLFLRDRFEGDRF
jgi:uncharacterized RDD family membrane protein YckC